MRRIYIAAPYSKLTPDAREDVLAEIACYGGHLMMKGIDFYSPLHDTAPAFDTLERHEASAIPVSFFRSREPAFMGICTALHIINWPGWDISVGVANEIRLARIAQKPVQLVNLVTYELSEVPTL